MPADLRSAPQLRGTHSGPGGNTKGRRAAIGRIPYCLSLFEFVKQCVTSFITMPINTPEKKRNDLSLADKVKVIQMLSSVPKMSQAEVAKKFGCSQSQVSRASKNKDAIMQQWESNLNPNRKRKREGKDGAVEEALYRWFISARARSVPLSGPILKEKAKSLAESMGDPDFNPSEGWLGRWKERHNISFRRAHGEKKDADTSAAEDWLRDVLPGILQSYDPENIYNCDETGLFYRALPNGTLAVKSEEVAGTKKAMDRISLLGHGFDTTADRQSRDSRAPPVNGMTPATDMIEHLRDYALDLSHLTGSLSRI
ncbi:Tigger transposable element-derived protein 3 [Branchiostoma belcheri]|nr:Tigger transposable element-derived protein 3 [Branchiostoma belcheri]